MRAESKVHVGIALGIAGVVAVGGQAIAANDGGGTPANKAIASGSTVQKFSPGTSVQLLSATLRTSKPTDLMLHTSLECSILTKLQTGPSTESGASSTASARGYIRGWIEVDDDPASGEATEVGAPQRIVPIASTSQPPQDGSTPGSGTKASDSVTYCDRTYQRTVEDAEDDGIDRETDYINTKSANAFNWVLLNAGSGVHYVRLMADLVAGAAADCTADTITPVTPPEGADGYGCSSAYVGNRTMIVEPTKMANDAVISDNASS